MSLGADRETARVSKRRDLTRELLAMIFRIATLVILVVLIPSLLPDDQNLQSISLIAGLIVVAIIYILFFVRQFRAVLKSKFPNLRAAEAMFTTVFLLISISASIYLALSQANSGAFTEELDSFSSVYFAITVLATVGFGDITPNTVAARTATMTQMVLDLIYIGVVVKVFSSAAKRSIVNKQSAQATAN